MGALVGITDLFLRRYEVVNGDSTIAPGEFLKNQQIYSHDQSQQASTHTISGVDCAPHGSRPTGQEFSSVSKTTSNLSIQPSK